MEVMSQHSLDQPTSSGYEAPRNTQYSGFLDNRCGRLHDLLKVFEGHQLQLAALSVVDAADHAVVRLVTSHAELARRLLTRHDVPFSESAIIVVELGGDHTILKLCLALLAAELNIHYAYPLMVRPHGRAALALHCDDQTLAADILLRKAFTLLGENDLGDQINPGDPFN
jgi:hypothetical protein